MPIDYSKYADNWLSEIRPAILERAGHKCEQCGVQNYAVGHRNSKGEFVPIAGNEYLDKAGNGELSYKQGREICKHYNECLEGEKLIVIVLTVAHLNHDVKDNRETNLKALCQKHHLAHDAKYKAEKRRKSKA